MLVLFCGMAVAIASPDNPFAASAAAGFGFAATSMAMNPYLSLRQEMLRHQKIERLTTTRPLRDWPMQAMLVMKHDARMNSFAYVICRDRMAATGIGGGRRGFIGRIKLINLPFLRT